MNYLLTYLILKRFTVSTRYCQTENGNTVALSRGVRILWGE